MGTVAGSAAAALPCALSDEALASATGDLWQDVPLRGAAPGAPPAPSYDASIEYRQRLEARLAAERNQGGDPWAMLADANSELDRRLEAERSYADAADPNSTPWAL